MRRLIIGLAMSLTMLPILAAVQAGPQAAIGLGMPAALAMIVVSAIALLLQRRRA